jgi:pyruvate dehydrogenase E2 component (dihydrolipoamide acetyltransferase)
MTAEIDVTDLLRERERLNRALPEDKITVNDLLIKAAALALEQVPALNASYGDDAVRRFSAVHIGFAVAIDEGLVTPVVRDCHVKSIGRIARESRELVARAKARTLTAQDLQGGTFTISNLGMFDVVEFSAIINPPQVGILAIAQPQQKPVVHKGRQVVRARLNATLSADHRAVDGITAARFLKALKDVLELPEKVLTS